MANYVFAISQFFVVCFLVADGKELLCRQLADGKELADGKLADSSSVEGIQCLLGETSVTKNCPATAVVHGTLHLGIGGRQPVRILCWRSVWCAPRVRLRFRTRPWSLAGGGAIGNLSGFSPARSLRPEDSTNVNTP